MARDTTANPRLGPKPVLATYNGQRIDPSQFDRDTRWTLLAYLGNRFYERKPRSGVRMFDTMPWALVYSPDREKINEWVSQGGGSGGILPADREAFEARYPGVKHAVDEWLAWAHALPGKHA